MASVKTVAVPGGSACATTFRIGLFAVFSISDTLGLKVGARDLGHCDVTCGCRSECRRMQIRQYVVLSMDEIDAMTQFKPIWLIEVSSRI